MCCQIEEDDDLEDGVENMKKAFTVPDNGLCSEQLRPAA